LVKEFHSSHFDIPNHFLAACCEAQQQAIRYTPRSTHLPAQLRGAASILGRESTQYHD